MTANHRLLQLFWLLVFAISPCLVWSQTATLRGQVIDQQTQEPLFAATVKAGKQGTVTDFDGLFELVVNTGEQTLEISYVGYETIRQTIRLEDGQTKQLTFELTEAVNLLQTATVTSGKYEKPLGEATVSLEVIKTDLIESTNANAVSDAIEKIPGVNLVGGQANIRGGSGFTYGAGSRVLLLVNDLPALQADAGTSNWGDMPVENIAQVEVIKGAASALYGSAAMNGLVNIRTGYASTEPETKIAIFGGIYDAPKDLTKKWWSDTRYQAGMQFSHKQKINKLDVVVSGRYQRNRDVRENFDHERIRFSGGLRYRITDRLSVGANMNFNKQDNQSYFYWLNAEEGHFRGDPTTFSNTQPTRFFIDPFASYFDKKGNRHKFTGRYFSIDNTSTTGTDNFSDNFYGSYQFQRKFTPQNLVLTTGLVAAQSNVTAPLYGDTSYVFVNRAAYLQLEKKLWERLNLTAGVRYEYNRITGPEEVNGQTIPDGRTEDDRPVFRFGANYQAAEATFLRASWGQGFRFPTIAEKYITTDLGGTPITPNPALESETGWSAEIGIKQGFQISNWQGFLDLAGFWMEYEDMIEFAYKSFADGFQASNIGNTVIKGGEFSVQGQGSIGNIPTSIIAGYTFIDPKFKDFTDDIRLRSSVNYNILKYRSKHTVKFDIESRFLNERLNIGTGLFYNSHLEAIDAIFEALVIPGLRTFRQENNKGFLTLNVRMGYMITDQLKASMVIRNITNELYSKRPGLLEPTRLWSVRMDYRF